MTSTARSGWLVVAALILAPATAVAEDVKLVKGGPTSKSAKQKLVTSLEQVHGLTAVCWQSSVSKPVRIELTVAADGTVERAKRKTCTSVGQCVAGILAVQRLSAAGSKFTAVVELGPASSGGKGGGMEQIKRELGPYREKLQLCYDKVAVSEPDLAGAVEIGFLIKPDGRVIEPTIKATTLGHQKVEQCLIDTMKAARLSARPGGKTVSFALALSFSGGPGPDAGAGTAGGGLRPSKDGPVPADVLSKVMNQNRAKFSACYDNVARKNPKLAGVVVLRYTVKEDGTVRNVKIKETTLGNKTVEDCIVKVGEKLKFPVYPSKTKVIYPFDFKPAK